MAKAIARAIRHHEIECTVHATVFMNPYGTDANIRWVESCRDAISHLLVDTCNRAGFLMREKWISEKTFVARMTWLQPGECVPHMKKSRQHTLPITKKK